MIGRAPFDTQLSLIDVRWLPLHAITEGVSTNGADASADDCVEAAAPGAVGNREQYRANSKRLQQRKVRTFGLSPKLHSFPSRTVRLLRGTFSDAVSVEASFEQGDIT